MGKFREWWLSGSYVQSNDNQQFRMAMTYQKDTTIEGDHIEVIEKAAFTEAVELIDELERFITISLANAYNVDNELLWALAKIKAFRRDSDEPTK